MDNNTDRTSVICGTAVIEKHGGLTVDSVMLPPWWKWMKMDICGPRQPSPSDSSATDEDKEPEILTSVIQLGAPPP